MEALQAQLLQNEQQSIANAEVLHMREEDILSKCAENEVLKEKVLDHAQHLAEVEARLALVMDESKSKDDERIRKMKEAGQTLNQNMKEFDTFDDALNALLELLVELTTKPKPTTTMLNEMESQELPYGQAILSQNARTRLAEPEPQKLPYSRQASVSTPNEASNERDTLGRCLSRGDQRSLTTQELEIKETTYCHSITKTRSTRGMDGASLFGGTPSRASKTSFPRFDECPHQNGSESPMLDTTGLFPPTPIPFPESSNAQVSVSTPGKAAVFVQSGVYTTLPDGEDSVAQGTFSKPRSILKQSRPGKRKLSVSFLWSPIQPNQQRRASTVERQGLGPIIPDSQNSYQGVETKANTKARKSTRNSTGRQSATGMAVVNIAIDKFIRRFNNPNGL